MTDIPAAVLACPKCQSTASSGLNTAAGYCATCETRFFELDGMPCWFPAGVAQKYLWEDLLAKFIEHESEAEKVHLGLLSDIGHSPTTRRRLGQYHAVAKSARRQVVQILRRAGLRPSRRKEFEHFSPAGLFQYTELMLRDWGWAPLGIEPYRAYEDENAKALQALLDALASVGDKKFGRVLFIGSGAGRLSWDLHRKLEPELTLALDKHPLLAYVSKLMARDGATLEFPETRLYPHEAVGSEHLWTLRSEGDDELRKRWHVMAADAWAAPLQTATFDLVVTPWFADINGRDCKDLIGLVDSLLKPGGYWLNHGPFLYPDDLPDSLKYTPQELRELLDLSGFRMSHDAFTVLPYTWSPLSERGRTEEVWTFLAQRPEAVTGADSAPEVVDTWSSAAPPPWIVLPHLPVPALAHSGRFPPELGNITALMDGTRSINDIAQLIERSLPEDVSARQFVYDFFREYLFTSR